MNKEAQEPQGCFYLPKIRELKSVCGEAHCHDIALRCFEVLQELLGKNAGLPFGFDPQFLMDDILAIKKANQHTSDLRFAHSGFFLALVRMECAILIEDHFQSASKSQDKFPCWFFGTIFAYSHSQFIGQI